jgi:hypothetical protein
MRQLERLRDLWAGRLPLADVFWTYNVFWGLLLNIGATIGAFAVLVGGKEANPQLAAAVSLALHLLPIPYNVLVLIGVWRSAGRSGRPPLVRGLARVLALFLFAAFILI